MLLFTVETTWQGRVFFSSSNPLMSDFPKGDLALIKLVGSVQINTPNYPFSPPPSSVHLPLQHLSAVLELAGLAASSPPQSCASS